MLYRYLAIKNEIEMIMREWEKVHEEMKKFCEYYDNCALDRMCLWYKGIWSYDVCRAVNKLVRMGLVRVVKGGDK